MRESVNANSLNYSLPKTKKSGTINPDDTRTEKKAGPQN
jgi:hypothetical protein